MEKRKQASRTPNASRNTTARSMSERQGVRGLLNLAAAFGVREACFRFAMKPLKLCDEPYVRRGSSPPQNEMLSLTGSLRNAEPERGRKQKSIRAWSTASKRKLSLSNQQPHARRPRQQPALRAA